MNTRPMLHLAMALVASPLTAQDSERIATGGIYETYSFGDGYVVSTMSQLTVPASVQVSLGRRASVLLSTGYVMVDLESADPGQLASRSLYGPLDTDLRLDYDLLPDRLLTFVSATLPTGRQTLVGEEAGIALALSNDVIGFTAPSLGSGGRLNAGFSTAMPVGGFALGVAGTAGYAFAYEPAASQNVTLRPGAEARLRVGLEGPLATRTYLRVAGSVAARRKDRLAGATTTGLGHRVLGYVTIEQGIGSMLLSLYGFEVYRGSPQLESTAVGVAILPSGSLMAGGLALDLPLGAATTATPSVEYRVASAAPSVDESRLERQASSLRAGLRLRQRIGHALALVVRGEGAFGEMRQAGTFHDFTGFLAGVTLEVTP